jgi:hypothetical protein
MKRLEVDEVIIGKPDGPQLRLKANEIIAYDTQGQTRFHLMIERGGTPNLAFCDGNGTERISLRVEENGCPVIRLRDGNFTERLSLELGEDEGEADVTFSDRSDNRIGLIGQDHSGNLYIRVPDEQGLLKPWVPTLEGTNGQAAAKKEA